MDVASPHVVVAVGIGNNSSLVFADNGAIDRRATSLAEAPYYKNVPPNEYGRYIALYQLAEDGHNGGTVDGTIDAAEYFETARFISVLDTKGEWYDEEEAEYSGVKK